MTQSKNTRSNGKTSSKKSDVAAPIHPGEHVRTEVLSRKGLSVVAAAKLVGVGRPALSNFLNGRAAATADMATRIERAFDVDAQTLLDMQAAYDAWHVRAKGVPANAIPYVVPFLDVKARDLEAWVDRNTPARSRFAVFLRTLANSTGRELTKIDFPGNDDAERPGWDGYIEAREPTSRIPDGISGWEFGTNGNIKEKADGDFAKSVKATEKSERETITFVFVTPRHWPAKAAWVKAQKSKGLWKDVRAFDSSDLEQWLEQSIAGQVWFANETGAPSGGVRSLAKCWDDWAMVTSPPLVGSLFTPAIDASKRMMLSRLSQAPDEPIIIASDSAEEALAFLAQLFGPAGGDELAARRERVLVFGEPGILPKLAQGSKDFIAVATSREVERELGPLSRSIHTIVVYPRNAANAEPHVVLEPLNYEALRNSLQQMGYDQEEADRLGSHSGRSLTVLRRRLSNVPAIKTPRWAADHVTATSLIPFLFAGAWSAANSTDQTVLVLLAQKDGYEQVEKDCQRLAALEDPPLWSVGIYRGVISKIDLLFAIAGAVTAPDLLHYFELAEMVLGEDDPRLDLPEDKRWAAPIYGKSREFSGALREGISETLVLLAVHGNNLFRNRTGFDCQAAVTVIVRKLLTPLKTRVLEANDRDLVAYSEAAPDEFISILADDLRSESPACYGLMRPADSGIFGNGCPRTGLLWALEGLAWNPATLPSVALILAQLAEIEITDNWTNKPINSLESIFRAWMPQTAANHDQRLQVMRLLTVKFPKVAWSMCIDQFDGNHRVGHYSHKPKWRTDGYGFGQPFGTTGPIQAFVHEMVEMALNWNVSYSANMLCDLIQCLHGLPEEYQVRILGLVTSWAAAGAADSDKALVREKIRVTVMSRRGAMRSKPAEFAVLSAAAKSVYQALQPSDLFSKHAWLFRESWVEESADELSEDDLDFEKRDERINKLRTKALSEILAAKGIPGTFEFAELGQTASNIGWILAKEIVAKADLAGLLVAALQSSSGSMSRARKNIVSGVLQAVQDEETRISTLRATKEGLAGEDFVQVLLQSPFKRSTWRLVDELSEQHRATYWLNVSPEWLRGEDSESNEAVERLMLAKRPRAAFFCIHLKLKAVSPELLFRLMLDVGKDGSDQPGHYQLEQYYIDEAFTLIDESAALTLEQKASLEFAYIDSLARPWSRHEKHGIPNLEKYVEANPDLFVRAIVWTYKRSDGGEDPAEWTTEPEQAEGLARRGYALLDGLSQIPGHNDIGELEAPRLSTWVKAVRRSCSELGRQEIADVCVGKLLSHAPVGTDGVWPCEPVRRVMEELHSKSMMRGAHTGLYNARGATWRGEGGAQERALADSYRAWANSLQYSHPFVASELLADMVKTYEREADMHDTEAGVRKRLP